jgi:hypothetical protein
VAGSCEHGNEPLTSVKVRGYPDQWNDCLFLKEVTVP